MELYTPDHVPGPFGMNNTGAICYFNSLLQALLSCPALTIAVYERSQDESSPSETTKEYFEYASKANLAKAEPFGNLRVLSALLADLDRLGKRRRFGAGQECASEAFIYMLECMSAPTDLFDDLFMHAFVGTVYCPNCREVVSTSRDRVAQMDMYFMNDLPDVSTPHAFARGLVSHSQPLDDYVCDRCRQKIATRRQYKMVLCPEIVVCLFDIYGFYHPRPTVPHYFPPEFQLQAKRAGPNDPDSNEEQVLEYRAVAQIEHFGSMGGGHYVARGLRNDGKVYVFNDSSVPAVSAIQPTPNTYLVFYHVTDAPKRFLKR